MAESISARVAWKLKKAIVGRPAKGTSNTGTASFVRTDENGVGWVRLPGADTDTPINGNLVTDMKPGDTVSYRIDGGRLSIMGNATSPSTSAGYVHSVVEPVEVKADEALNDAMRARDAADEAERSAERAGMAADSATASANSALVQLSVIEDVAGTLDWISQYGSYVLTTDTSVVSGKVYFELVSGEYIPIASPDPSANPQSEGWYVLDITDSQTEYIMAHLAVTSAGLWVLPNGIGSGQTPATASGYKVLLSNTGMTVYDPTGADVAHYGTTSRIGSVSALHLLLRATGIVLMPANGESSQQSLKNISDFFVDQDTYLENPLDQSSALFTGLVGKLNNLLSTPSGLIYSVDDDYVLIITDTGAQIGSSSNSHVSMDYHSLKLVDREGSTYFHVSDLRGPDGTLAATDTFVGDGSTKRFDLMYQAASTDYTVTVSDGSGGTISKQLLWVTFSSPPTNGATITVEYTTTVSWAKAYTLGTRGAGNVGAMSVASGYECVASNEYAHAEGFSATASGSISHAEGGYTVASGSYSHAQNNNTVARGNSQTAIGRYNDNDPNNAFEIGNGTADNARSNALAVDWDGNLTAGNFRDAAMTRDLGSSGTVRACRIGSMVVMSGVLGGCTVSDTYTWTHLAHIDPAELGITSVGALGAMVDVSGGGPSYYGSTNGGGTARIVDGVLYADMQTNAAFSSRFVKFLITAYVE